MKNAVTTFWSLIISSTIAIAASTNIALAQGALISARPSAEPPPAYGYRITANGSTFIATSVGMARAAVRDLLQKRRRVTRGLRPTMRKNRRDLRVLDVTGVRITASTIAFDYSYSEGDAVQPAHEEIDLGRQSYFLRVDDHDKEGPFSAALPKGTKAGSNIPADNLFAWTERGDAERFCEAMNRLIYAARVHEVAPAPMPADFSATAKAWRDVPDSRVSPPPQWQHEREMAEAAVKDNDAFTALAHYETGVFLFPTWPEGWFNAALLYESIGEYPYAANRMQHYLELLPNARDAAAAREKVMAWEEKGRQ